MGEWESENKTDRENERGSEWQQGECMMWIKLLAGCDSYVTRWQVQGHMERNYS